MKQIAVFSTVAMVLAIGWVAGFELIGDFIMTFTAIGAVTAFVFVYFIWPIAILLVLYRVGKSLFKE